MASYIKAHYHPFLFALMSTCALAELGLTAFLIEAGNEHHTWPSPRYHSLLLAYLFNATWTMLFSMAYVLWIIDGAVHLLASIASSIIWLLVTSILWGTTTGIMRKTRTGGDCANMSSISRCRQSLTVEALGWAEFGLCLLTLLATLIWLRTGKRNYRSSFYADEDWP